MGVDKMEEQDGQDLGAKVKQVFNNSNQQTQPPIQQPQKKKMDPTVKRIIQVGVPSAILLGAYVKTRDLARGAWSIFFPPKLRNYVGVGAMLLTGLCIKNCGPISTEIGEWYKGRKIAAVEYASGETQRKKLAQQRDEFKEERDLYKTEFEKMNDRFKDVGLNNARIKPAPIIKETSKTSTQKITPPSSLDELAVYFVTKTGTTLSGISHELTGDYSFWPEIAAFNDKKVEYNRKGNPIVKIFKGEYLVIPPNLPMNDGDLKFLSSKELPNFYYFKNENESFRQAVINATGSAAHLKEVEKFNKRHIPGYSRMKEDMQFIYIPDRLVENSHLVNKR